MPSRSRLGRWVFIALLGGLVAFGWQRRAVWRTQLVDRSITGDAAHYFLLAVHLEAEHQLSFDGKRPQWTRLPGYPVFLTLFARPSPASTRSADIGEQNRRTWAWIKTCARANAAVDVLLAPVAALLALGLGAGGLALLAALAWVLQPWSSVVAAHALSDGLATLLTTGCLACLVRAAGDPRRRFLLVGAALLALCQWVRGDAVLLLPVLLVAALLGPPGSTQRQRGQRALWAILTFALVFCPWPLRNLAVFGAPHALGGVAGIDDRGAPVDREAFLAVLRTLPPSEATTLRLGWRYPGQSLTLADVPATVGDAVERAALGRVIDAYNASGYQASAAVREGFAALARERCRRRLLDCYLGLPAQRVWFLLRPPRDGFGLGSLPTLRDHRDAWCRADRAALVAGLLGLLVLAVAPGRRPQAMVVAGWLALRLAALAWMATPEPRYLLEALPLLCAAAASLPASTARLVRAATARV